MKALINVAPLLAVALFAAKAHKAGVSPIKVIAGTAIIGGVIGVVEYAIANRAATA